MLWALRLQTRSCVVDFSPTNSARGKGLSSPHCECFFGKMFYVFAFSFVFLFLQVQSEDSVLLFVIAWTITEIIRYSFYTFSLLNHLPYLIKWARYTLFIVLYPMGVSGELLTIYAALPFVRQAGLYSISLPNKYNFSFDYYAFLILIMISYIPTIRTGHSILFRMVSDYFNSPPETTSIGIMILNLILGCKMLYSPLNLRLNSDWKFFLFFAVFPQLYFHMIHQRRKILSHTEEHKKFE
ncbi:HACD2 [Cervus elaphus hippelaphus]|uniref:Very-long-chain (3R)-3-hydroxyacyl-CoA dehydratase n=1 Tax=Cervus elaphus hippelaphus TaxID=46360 RepID=A0A212CK15_CEREH|nr:HACD2 [Cervus elaphus hippelaphus]